MSQVDTSITAPAAQGKARTGKKAPVVQGPASRPTQQARQVVTFESAQRICPNNGMAAKFASRFGLDDVDYHAIREATEEHMARMAKALADNGLVQVDQMGERNDKPLEMHMQRVVDGFVRSAHGAGNFYEGKAQVARDLTSKIANEDRDEDRPGIDNTANRAERARSFAARVGLQAYALLAAAEGAVDAYAHVCGQDWKPYQGNQAPAQQVSRQAAAAQISAFDRE